VFGILIGCIPLFFFHSARVSMLFVLYSFFLGIVQYPIVFFVSLKLYISYYPVNRLLVIGKKEKIETILEEVEEKSFGKLQVYRYMNPSSLALQEELNVPIAFDEIVIADQELASHVENVLLEAHEKHIPVKYLPTLVEENLQRIPMSLLESFKDYYEVAFSKVNDSPAKRIYDVVLSVLALIGASPLFLLICFLIVVESGFPVIYKQKRTGKELTPFTMLKFRTLKTISKETLNKMTDPNQTIEARATKTGKLLRKVRFDEIPQFWNVLKGNMSVIGPRPEMDAYHEKGIRHIPFYRFRYKLKPGITGWAQINYKHTSELNDYMTKTEYDLYYIKNRSILIDLQVTLRTIETMLGLRGSK
jgi:lipopolysaccharide/colanic/teichoic acid biosynthesis glycosyltransferase